MKRATLSRRLVAGAAGLAIGLGSMFAMAGPAQAVVDAPAEDTGPIKVTQPTCEDANGYIVIPAWTHLRKWQIDGEDAQPGEHTVGTGTYLVERVGKLTGHVWVSVTVEIKEAEGCEPDEEEHKSLIKDPTKTQPTCEDPNGYIHIPGIHKLHVFNYLVDGVPAERGSTVAVEPGTVTVVAVGKFSGKIYNEWIFDIVAPDDCPEDDPGETPGETPSEEPPGEGGELPKTGTQVALIAGGALLLLTAGGAMFFVARRRRISFTA